MLNIYFLYLTLTFENIEEHCLVWETNTMVDIEELKVSIEENSSSPIEEKTEASLFKICSIKMSNEKKETLWKTEAKTLNNNDEEVIVHLPSSILQEPVIVREIKFSTGSEAIEKLRLTQNIRLHDNLVEQWDFSFGFCIPFSTNTWEQMIIADENTMDPSILSGNVTIETTFYNEHVVLSSSLWRVFYT